MSKEGVLITDHRGWEELAEDYRKKILIATPPFYGHWNVLEALGKRLENIFDIDYVSTGWTDISSPISNPKSR